MLSSQYAIGTVQYDGSVPRFRSFDDRFDSPSIRSWVGTVLNIVIVFIIIIRQCRENGVESTISDGRRGRGRISQSMGCADVCLVVFRCRERSGSVRPTGARFHRVRTQIASADDTSVGIGSLGGKGIERLGRSGGGDSLRFELAISFFHFDLVFETGEHDGAVVNVGDEDDEDEKDVDGDECFFGLGKRERR